MSEIMTFWIEELAQEAADPIVAGMKMRQVFYTLNKLTNRQLTVDLLRKLYERKVGTHEVESVAKKLVKGETRRNPELVKTILQIKLDDALVWVNRIKKQLMREKVNLYISINRGGLLKEEFWSRAISENKKRWKAGKEKIQEKVNRLENTYKGVRTYTGMVGNIRVGDRELGEDEEASRDPLTVGVEINESEAKVLTKDQRFRDWNKISKDDVECDINVGLDNLRREIRKVEENGGTTLTEEEAEIERENSNVVRLKDKALD